MKKIFGVSSIFIVLFLLNSLPGYSQNVKPAPLKTLIVFFDGLRIDYITPEKMPNLYALKQQGTYGLHHHSVFPTVTRVNAASYATGSYPAQHGLMGNSVYFPEVDKTKGYNSGDAKDLIHIKKNLSGPLVTAVSLGEIVQAAGSKLMVFSSGSTGQAYLQNHTISGGAIINPDMILPTTFEKEVFEAIGLPPAATKPNEARHQWITDAFLKYGLAEDGPLVSAIWFSDPDGSAHSFGIGSAQAMASIKIVDQQLGTILEAIVGKNYNIVISTDHGFVTNIGEKNLADVLIEKGLKANKESDDVLIIGSAIYVKNHDKKTIQKIAELLQSEEWIGAVFSKADQPGSTIGWVAGTLSYESIHWDHPERMADLQFAVNWNDDVNEFGYAGSSFAKGIAGHGGSSSHEIHIPLILYGSSFKKANENMLPTSNIDIVPTILHAHNLEIPKTMQGRVMDEVFKNSAKTKVHAKKEIISTSTDLSWGTYKLMLTRTIYGKHEYVDFTKVERILK